RARIGADVGVDDRTEQVSRPVARDSATARRVDRRCDRRCGRGEWRRQQPRRRTAIPERRQRSVARCGARGTPASGRPGVEGPSGGGTRSARARVLRGVESVGNRGAYETAAGNGENENAVGAAKTEGPSVAVARRRALSHGSTWRTTNRVTMKCLP